MDFLFFFALFPYRAFMNNWMILIPVILIISYTLATLCRIRMININSYKLDIFMELVFISIFLNHFLFCIILFINTGRFGVGSTMFYTTVYLWPFWLVMALLALFFYRFQMKQYMTENRTQAEYSLS